MARLLWLADVLRAAGLVVHEYPDWRTRGADTFGPVRGIICHGTGGSLTSTDKGEINVIAITGSRTAPEVPIAQLYQSRSGEWTVIASGTATGVKTGTAGPHEGYSDDALLQIEAQHNGAEPWTQVQYESYVRGVAALVAKLGISVSMVAGHYEHQPNEKTDPWFDMGQFRRDVTAVLEGEGMLTADERGNLKATDERVRKALILGEEYQDDDPDIGLVTPWIVTAINGLQADVTELKLGGVDLDALVAKLVPRLVDALGDREAAADRARADVLDGN